MPMLPRHAGPLAIGQARRPRLVEDIISEALPSKQKLSRANTVAGSPAASRKSRPQSVSDVKEVPTRRPRRPAAIDTVNGIAVANTTPNSPFIEGRRLPSHRQSMMGSRNPEGFTSTSSLPSHRQVTIPAAPFPASPGVPRRPNEMSRRHSQAPRPTTPSSLSQAQKIRLLRQNYFRSETQLLSALEGISSRLVAVPKPARLSALRAELALIAQDLPAEVDIPLICPATLIEGTASRSRHHRIVRLNPAEATSLNSAEKVPYLLMLEILREDFDFDPDTEDNTRLLTHLLSDKGRSRRRLFDTTHATRNNSIQSPQDPTQSDSVLEPVSGDLSSVSLLEDLDADGTPKTGSPSMRSFKDSPQLPSGASLMSLPATNTIEGTISRSGSPANRSSPFMKPQVSTLR